MTTPMIMCTISPTPTRKPVPMAEEELMDPLADVLAAIAPPDAEAMAAARERQDRMTKPRGSLGALEEVSVRLAGLAGSCPPPLPEPACVAVFAADHGVHAQGVTPWPQEVTAQMVANFLAGGAVVNAFAAQAGPRSPWSTSGWPPTSSLRADCFPARSAVAPLTSPMARR